MRGAEIVLQTQGTGGSPEADGEGREWDGWGADRLKNTFTQRLAQHRSQIQPGVKDNLEPKQAALLMKDIEWNEKENERV